MKLISATANKSNGFTLIELLVVTAIFTVITSLVLASNSRFGGAVLLENLAYDIALSIRQAQIYGIAVHRFGTNNFGVGYGEHFEMTSPTTYVLFGDVNQTGLYDDPTELVTSTDIGRGYYIADLCVTPSNDPTETCGVRKLDILFKRPEPDAYIRADGSTSVINQRGRIIVKSPRGDQMSIVIEATGQIGVQP